MENLKLHSYLVLLVLAFSSSFSDLSAFTVLSGPLKATIKPNNGSTSTPQVIFDWDGSTPEIVSTDTFLEGKHVGKTGAALMRAIIEESLDIWNQIPGTDINLVLDANIDAGAKQDRLDLKHSIFADDIGSASTAAAALPNYAYNKDINPDRDIVDCDIQIGITTYTAEELAFTIAHEVGHCLGIGHNHLVADAIMTYRNTERRFKLSADDKMAAMFLYPSSDFAEEPKDFLGCGVIGFDKAHTGLRANIGLLLLPLLLLILLQLFSSYASFSKVFFRTKSSKILS
jgi:hypothetical protein